MRLAVPTAHAEDLFYHGSEVRSSRLLCATDEVEFLVVRNPFTGKLNGTTSCLISMFSSCMQYIYIYMYVYIYICVYIFIYAYVHTYMFSSCTFRSVACAKKKSAQPAPCTPRPVRGGELTLERVDSDTNPPPPSQRASATLRQCNAGW